MMEQVPEEAMEETRLDVVEILEEERETVLKKTKAVQAQRKRRYDKRIQHEDIKESDIALLYDSTHQKCLSTFHFRWLGLYLITTIYKNGSLGLSTLNGEPLLTRNNWSRIRKYHDLKQEV